MTKNMAIPASISLLNFILFTFCFCISEAQKDGGAPMSLKEAQEAAEHDGGQAVVDFWRNFHIPSGENKGKVCAVETLTFNIYFDNGKCDWGNQNLPDKLYYDNYIHKINANNPVLHFALTEEGGQFLGESVNIRRQTLWYWVEKATFAGEPITLNFDGCWKESPNDVAEALKGRHASLLFYEVVPNPNGRGMEGPLLYWTDGLEVTRTSAYGSRVTAELHPSATKYTHGWPDTYAKTPKSPPRKSPPREPTTTITESDLTNTPVDKEIIIDEDYFAGNSSKTSSPARNSPVRNSTKNNSPARQSMAEGTHQEKPIITAQKSPSKKGFPEENPTIDASAADSNGKNKNDENNNKKKRKNNFLDDVHHELKKLKELLSFRKSAKKEQNKS